MRLFVNPFRFSPSICSRACDVESLRWLIPNCGLAMPAWPTTMAATLSVPSPPSWNFFGEFCHPCLRWCLFTHLLDVPAAGPRLWLTTVLRAISHIGVSRPANNFWIRASFFAARSVHLQLPAASSLHIQQFPATVVYICIPAGRYISKVWHPGSWHWLCVSFQARNCLLSALYWPHF